MVTWRFDEQRLLSLGGRVDPAHLWRCAAQRATLRAPRWVGRASSRAGCSLSRRTERFPSRNRKELCDFFRKVFSIAE